MAFLMSDVEDFMTPTSFPLLLSRDRDAWATIRGFVYQVDRTIAEWLDLGVMEVLELERGEDIDRITTALRDTGTKQHRRLEQVKHRERRLTLRSSAAREALANFFQHRTDNPTLTMRFRFTTTASIGQEQRNNLPGRLPGIAAWEQVRSGGVSDSDGRNLLRGLHKFVLTLSQPAEVLAKQWSGFQAFVRNADDDAWYSFVTAFEWATAAPDSQTLRVQIRTRLKEEHAFGTQEEADLAYQNLFYIIFDKLSNTGLKRLTRADLLDGLSALPTPINQTLFAELAALHDALTVRVDALEQQVHKVEQVVAGVAAEVDLLGQRAGITALIDPRDVAAPSTAPPPRSTLSSPRTTTIDTIMEAVQPRVMILSGGLMAGKTQLALLISERLGSTSVWFRLANAKPPEAARRLSQAVDTVLTNTHDVSRVAIDWEVSCAGVAAGTSVIVLEDVPTFREGDVLGSRLVPLVTTFLEAGKTVLLTSTGLLTTLERLVPPERLSVVPVPPLTIPEVQEVLAAYEAPAQARAPHFVALLVSITSGHPLLIQTAAQWLQRRGWETDLAGFNQILRDGYVEPVSQETTQALLDSVSDWPARNLLYRLSLVGGEFGPGELVAVAEVTPSIQRRGERFATLLGPWVQPTASERYVVSPLVRALGDQNLEVAVRRECHLVLGLLIVKRRSIGELAFMRALNHFVVADDLDRAAILLIQGLFAVYTRPPVSTTLITAIWSDTPIPIPVQRPYRAMIRAIQAVIAHREGRDPAPFLEELAATLDAWPRLEPWAEFAPTVFVAVAFASADAATAAPFVQRSLKVWWALGEHWQDALHLSSRESVPAPDSLVWICIGGIHDQAGLQAWMDMVRVLPRELQQQLFESPLGIEATTTVAGRVLLWEYDTPTNTRDWNRAVQRLEHLETVSQAIGATSLVAASRSARISALVEGSEDLEPGLALAEATLSDFGADPDAAFLAAKAMGYGALDRGHPETAQEWFSTADALPGTAHAVDRLRIKLRLAQLVGPVDPASALAFAESAVALAPSATQSFLPSEVETKYGRGLSGDTIVPGAMGELALAYWFAGDRHGAYRTWLRALDALAERRADEDQAWKSLFVVMGHVSGYFTGIATLGAPPSTTDGEPYPVPQQGMFINPKKEAATQFRPELVPVLGVHAMQLADTIGEGTLAVSLARQASERLRAAGLWTVAKMPEERLLEEAIMRGDFTAALEHAEEVVTAFWVTREQDYTSGSLFVPSDDPREVLDGQPNSDRIDMDGMVVRLAVLPAFVRVGFERERDANSGDSLGKELHAACCAAATADPDSVIWPEVVAISEATFLDTPDANDLGAWGNRLQDSQDGFRSVAALAFFGGALDPRADPRSRAKLHLAVSQYVLEVLALSTTLYDRLGATFFSQFWRRVFETGRMHFLTPALVEKALDDAAQAPPSQQPRLVLKTIAWGLNVPLPSAVKDWLTKSFSGG